MTEVNGMEAEEPESLKEAGDLIYQELKVGGRPQMGRPLFSKLKAQLPSLERKLFYDAIQHDARLLLYPTDQFSNYLGLSEWGPGGYQQAVELSWKAIHKLDASQLRALDSQTLDAIRTVAAKKGQPEFLASLRSSALASTSSTTYEEAPTSGKLKDWQTWLAGQLSDIQLLGQLNLTPDQHQVITAELRQRFENTSTGQTIEFLASEYPLVLATFLVFHGIFNFFSNTYWPMVCEALDLPYNANTSTRFGQAFEQVLRRYRLPRFQQLDGPRYVSRIVGHGGLPVASLRHLFASLVLPSLTEPELQQLSMEELGDYFAHREHDQAVGWFLRIGGKFAEDILERCRDLAREALRAGHIDASEFGLPKRYAEGLEAALKVVEHVERKTNLLPRPYLSFDPWAEGLRVEFPPARVQSDGPSWVEVVWQVNFADQILTHRQKCSRNGPLVDLPPQRFQLAAPAREYRCKLLVQEKTLLSVNLAGLSKEKPLMLFSPRTGKALGHRVPDRQAWILCPTGEVKVDGSPAQILEEFPRHWGAWQNYRAYWLELANATALSLSSPAFTLALSPEVPMTLCGRMVVSEFAGESGIPVYAEQLPELMVGLTDLRGWTLQVSSDFANRKFTHQEILEHSTLEGAEVALDLHSLLGESQAGEYRVLLRGQLGQDSRRIFRFVPSLRIFLSQTADHRGELLATVSPGTNWIQDSRHCEPLQKKAHEWLYRLESLGGRSHISGVLEYPRASGPAYPLPILLPSPNPCWALSGVDTGGALHWDSKEVSIPLHILEQAGCPELLIQVAEKSYVTLEIHGNAIQASVPVLADPEKSRGRARHALAPFLDTLRSSNQVATALMLRVEGSGQVRTLPALRVVRDWTVGGFQAESLVQSRGYRLDLKWTQAFPACHRCLRIWSLTEPWLEPLEVDVPDERVDQFTVPLGDLDLHPGYFQAELFVKDPWLQTSLPPRPPRNAPNCAVFQVDERQIENFVRNLPRSGLSCFQHFLMDREQGRHSHVALFTLPEVLRTDELEDFLRGILRLIQEQRYQDSQVKIAIGQYFYRSLQPRLLHILRALPALLRDEPPSYHRRLTSWLLQMHLTIDHPERLFVGMDKDGLSEGEREFLWQLWEPFGLILDLHAPDPSSHSRALRYLGPGWSKHREQLSLSEWGRCPGPEVRYDSRALKQVWGLLDITPTTCLDDGALQKAYFQMCLGATVPEVREQAVAWAAQDCQLLEQEVNSLCQKRRISQETRQALMQRHPKHCQGDLLDPMTRIPFMVGAVAFIQRLCALQNEPPGFPANSWSSKLC